MPIDNTLAFVFPGQGSQTVGMLADLAITHSEIKDTFDEASEALGRDLWLLAQEGPADKQNQTQNTQPLVLTASVAIWRIWQKQSTLKPAYMAGHSLGEYTALVCADSLSFIDAVKLVEKRACFMQQAVAEGEGSMAAILGLDLSVLMTICAEAAENEVVSAVNFNAPGQIVIAGNTKAVNRAIELAKAQGAKRALALAVSVPSHCALMEPAATNMSAEMSNVSFSTPNTTILHNTDVASHDDVGSIKNALEKQLYTPVRWTETVETLVKREVTTIVECGPGKVLSGLNKRIDKTLTLHSLTDLNSFSKALEALT
ncbi:MAG: ACP S-malonyltransferase [Cycloclasticus sp.]|nr:ACP S-malonyltransferase [Cycloclasticus sp.]MBQ0789985.1 ACP S-malonyltransferase [Cycloclasticus sp.]